jgi:hypothetical protein
MLRATFSEFDHGICAMHLITMVCKMRYEVQVSREEHESNRICKVKYHILCSGAVFTQYPVFCKSRVK